MTASTLQASRVIAALIVGVLIYGLAMGTTYPLLGVVLSGQVSDALNGLNAAATGLGLIVGVLVMPQVARHAGAGTTALIGVGAMTAALLVLAFVREFWLVFAARLALGIGANLLFIVAETALNTFADPARRGRVMGLYSTAVAVGFVLGPAVVAALPDRPLPILVGCAAITAFAALPLLRAQRPVDAAVRPASGRAMLPAIIGYPSAFAFVFIGSCMDAVAISLLPVISRGQSFSLQEGALFVTVFHVGLLAGQPLIGVALDRLGRRRTVLGCGAISLVCTLVIAFGGPLGFWPVAVLMLLWGGANYGLYTGGLALIGDRFAGAALTAATIAFAAVYAIASAIAPALAGGATALLGATGFYVTVATIYLAATLVGVIRFRPAEPTL
ncbi:MULTISPECIES: MFS transporter [unclassified Roseitalea]|uniref:MFS transporter n=1 Tax=unclassified Roseitalea TaxID=2639107 RepID=UPI00273E9B82|nr:MULTISPECIES: MFS transporter [unclassified Roseitalea]